MGRRELHWWAFTLTSPSTELGPSMRSAQTAQAGRQSGEHSWGDWELMNWELRRLAEHWLIQNWKVERLVGKKHYLVLSLGILRFNVHNGCTIQGNMVKLTKSLFWKIGIYIEWNDVVTLQHTWHCGWRLLLQLFIFPSLSFSDHFVANDDSIMILLQMTIIWSFCGKYVKFFIFQTWPKRVSTEVSTL